MSPLVPAPVRALLALPGVLPLFAAALLGRLSFGTVGLALLLVVEGASGSYAVAGSALVAYGLTAALLAPLRARLVDRRGRRGVLPLLALGEAGVLVALALAAPVLPSPLLVALCGAAGCLVPPLGPVTRAVWAEVADGPDALRAAYSLDTVAEEGLFTVGPLLVAAVAALADPAAALLLTAGLLVSGSVALVRSPLAAGEARVAAPDAGPPGRPLRSAGFRRLLLVLLGAGAGLGGVELAVVAVADEQGSAAAAGVLLAALSLGSAVGGAAYGLRSWRRGAGHHLVVLLLLLAAALAALAAVAALGSVLLVGLVLLVAGLAVAPLVIAAYTRADALSDPGSRTEAGTLVGTVNNLGTAAGTGATGVLLDAHGPATALLAGAAVLAVTGLVAARSARDQTDSAARDQTDSASRG